MITNQTAIQLVNAGANLNIDGSTFLAEQLVELAGLAAANSCHLTIRNAEVIPLDILQQIALRGGNHVTFEF